MLRRLDSNQRSPVYETGEIDRFSTAQCSLFTLKSSQAFHLLELRLQSYGISPNVTVCCWHTSLGRLASVPHALTGAVPCLGDLRILGAMPLLWFERNQISPLIAPGHKDFSRLIHFEKFGQHAFGAEFVERDLDVSVQDLHREFVSGAPFRSEGHSDRAQVGLQFGLGLVLLLCQWL